MPTKARPKSRQVCEEFIAKALWTTNKIDESAGRSPRESPQLYEQLRHPPQKSYEPTIANCELWAFIPKQLQKLVLGNSKAPANRL